MIHPLIPIALLALVAPAAAALPDQRGADGIQLAQLSIHERIIIRIPRMPASRPVIVGRSPAVPPVVRWKEKKAPKCLAVGDIGGAMIVANDTIDLVMAGGSRMRARLDGDCKPLDFYSGFYFRPAAGDGMICADRDAIHVRSGASCPIDGFKRLEARR